MGFRLHRYRAISLFTVHRYFAIRGISNLESFEKSLDTRINRYLSHQLILNTYLQVTKSDIKVSHGDLVGIQRT